MPYYDWNKTLSYDADVNMVVGPRGCGKTFGLREQFMRDFDSDGSRFVQLTRTKAEIPSVMAGYFDKIVSANPRWQGYEIKYEGKRCYRRVKDGESKEWQLVGYFAALTEMQLTKQTTYERVKRIVLDEAIIDNVDRYHNYLPREWVLLANIVDSCARQNPDDEEMRPVHLYLLGNAVDLINPIFTHYRIFKPPRPGYSWHGGKTMLLHYVQDEGDYGTRKEQLTVAGRMLAGTSEGRAANFNDFTVLLPANLARKPAKAAYEFGVKSYGEVFGIWYDKSEGYYYVSRKHRNKQMFALTVDDARPDLISLRKNKSHLDTFMDLVYMGLVKFEDAALRDSFLTQLSLFGIR